MLGKFELKKDVERACEILKLSEASFADLANINLRTLQYNYEDSNNNEVLEKVYSTIYRARIRLNKIKSELYFENLNKDEYLLFHGSKNGIEKIDESGSRYNSDFGNGFYCSTSYQSSLAFIEMNESPSIYVFTLDKKDLSIIEIKPSREWMLIVCYFRGMIDQYATHPLMQKCLNMLKNKDVIIAPIADNRMFQIMRDFGEGNITDQQAIHALSASRLGNQYVFKTKKAIDKLKFIERLYVSNSERKNSFENTEERKVEIDNKLKLSKREFRNEGKYIDEVFE